MFVDAECIDVGDVGICLFVRTFDSMLRQRGAGTVRQGELEDSSVDPVNTMVHMMTAMQTYQSGENAIQTISSTMHESATSVGSLGG